MPPKPHQAAAGGEARRQNGDPLLRELRGARERLREVERVAGVGSYELDLRTGAVRWSDELYRIYGRKPGSFEPTLELGLELIHPDDRERIERLLTVAVAEGRRRASQSFRILRPDGEERTVLGRGELVLAGGEPVGILGTIQDVTERERDRRALEASERRYRALLEQVPAVVYIAPIGLDSAWRYVSPRIEEMLGWTPEEWLADAELWFRQIHPEDRSAVGLAEEQVARGGRFSLEYRMLARDGRVVWVRDDATVIPDPDGPGLMHGVLIDVTGVKLAEQALAEKHAQLQAIIDNSPLLIFAKDLEGRYLFASREFEELLRLRPGGAIARSDLEIVPPEYVDAYRESDRRALATGSALEVEHDFGADGRRSTYLVHKFPLRDADGRVYGVCGIAADVSERKAREEALRAKVEWSMRIRHAIRSNRLLLHAQPIVDLGRGDVVQEELLVRMRGERPGELVYPGEFLPQAERFGLIPAIDRWVVERALELASERRVEVNLSAASMADRELVGFVEEQLERTGADPANVVFEVTETAASEDLDAARDLAGRLTALGFGFALDDFGTGYGSFTYLKHLPVAYLKIDMEFVRGLAADDADRQVVSAIVDVARNFGIRTIAEGVESEAVLPLLRELGVDYAQGFFIGRPGPLRRRGPRRR